MRELLKKNSIKTTEQILFSQTQQEGSLCNHGRDFHKRFKQPHFSKSQASDFHSDIGWGTSCQTWAAKVWCL